MRSVLIVEENARLRESLCNLFRCDLGCEICWDAEDGRTAIDKAQFLRPSLVLTGLAIPHLNGLEETRILKKLMPGVPIIVYTVHCDPEVEKEVLAAGATAVLSKSEPVETLLKKAGELLGLRRACAKVA